MAKPILLAVDDDVSVLEAVVQDLRRKYGQKHRILRAASGQAALDICRQLKERNEVVALFLSDQRMPGMTGVDFLEAAIPLFPEAKRVLLTAYADTEAAIRAINSARIHYYLNKPWDPPEEKLYPVLDDLLASWDLGFTPPYDGIQLISTRWGAGDHEVRNFLSRNRVGFKWLNPDQTPEALELLRSRELDEAKLPVVLFPDGTSLVQPNTTQLAEKVGLRTQAQQEYYDVVVVGAGPAGLAAGVYGASEGLKTLLVEPFAPGGQAGSSSKIENYLGFYDGISGDELAKRAEIQANRLGAEFLTQAVTSIRSENGYHILRMTDDREVTCRVCLIATGVAYLRLDIGREMLSEYPTPLQYVTHQVNFNVGFLGHSFGTTDLGWADPAARRKHEAMTSRRGETLMMADPRRVAIGPAHLEFFSEVRHRPGEVGQGEGYRRPPRGHYVRGHYWACPVGPRSEGRHEHRPRRGHWRGRRAEEGDPGATLYRQQ